MSCRATVACTRAQADALPDPGDLFPGDAPPVIVADEPDPSKPDEWFLHAYFERSPSEGELAILRSLGSGEVQLRSCPNPTG